MTLPRKIKSLPPDDPSRDRFTAWIGLRKIEGIGKGVDRAYRLARLRTVLGFISGLVTAVVLVFVNR